MKEFIVNENAKLREFTDNYYPQGSFYFNRLLKDKEIKVNGTKVSSNLSLKAGDKVSYFTTPKQEEKTAFDILFEDDNILVADKESGVNSEAVYHTLAAMKECYFIHRLDRNTQGLLVFAKNKLSEQQLLDAFKNKKVQKKYRALCFGSFKKKEDTVTLYFKKDEKNSLVRLSDKESFGERMITEYRILKKEGDFNEVEIILHTGKTHQIRATMAYLSCPVAGDEKYGDNEKNKEYNLSRQCLISYCLSFVFSGNLSYLNGKAFYSQKKFNI